MKTAAAAVQKFITSSSLPTYNMITHKGVWRTLVIRCSARTKGMLAMIVAQTEGVEAEVWESEKQRFIREVTTVELEYPVRSLFVQEYNGVSSPPVDHPRTKVWGADFIEEVICGLTFRVSPDAFFQVWSRMLRQHLKSNIVRRIPLMSNIRYRSTQLLLRPCTSSCVSVACTVVTWKERVVLCWTCAAAQAPLAVRWQQSPRR
jgi:hypothetical protein